MNKDVEAGILTALFGVGVALSLGLAFGVLRAAVHAMSAAAVPARSTSGLAAGLSPLATTGGALGSAATRTQG
jgi:hypothetical protein